MILSKLLDLNESYLEIFFLYSLLSLVNLVILFINFNWWKSLILLFVISEVLYHILPRTKEEKRKGRDWEDVIGYKVDAIFDAAWITLIIAVVRRLTQKTTLDQWIHWFGIVGLGIGYIVGIILLIWFYLWLNKLRDRGTKKRK